MSSPTPVADGPFSHLVEGLLDEESTRPTEDPFEATTVSEAGPAGTVEGVRRAFVDHYIDLQPEGMHGFAGVLIDCWRERRSGVLRVQFERGVTSIFFSDGQPVFAECTDPNAFFGRMLVRLDRLTEENLQSAINVCSRQGRVDPFRFAEVLVETKLLDPQAVYEMLLLHACETILACFGFSEMRARFGPGRDAPVKFPFAVPSLVREGVERAYEQSQVDRIVAPWVNRRAQLRSNIEATLEQLGLTPNEHAFILELDGRCSLGETSQHSPMPPLETTRLVAALILLDLVDLVPVDADGGEIATPKARRFSRVDSV